MLGLCDACVILISAYWGTDLEPSTLMTTAVNPVIFLSTIKAFQFLSVFSMAFPNLGRKKMVPLISVSLFFSSIFQHGNSSGSGLDGIGTLNVTKSFRFSFTLALLLRGREATSSVLSHHDSLKRT